MSRTGWLGYGRRAGRAAVIAVIAGLWLAPGAARAGDPVVCATVYYTVNGGTPNYIVDDCFVPSPWDEQMDEVGCTTVVNGSTTIKVCRDIALSFPVP